MHHIVNPVKQFPRKKPNQNQQTTYKTTHIFADFDIWTTPQEKRKKERKKKRFFTIQCQRNNSSLYRSLKTQVWDSQQHGHAV